MKILQICMSRGFGGLELYVLKVAKYLANNNFQFNVLTRKDSFLTSKLSENQIPSESFTSVFYHLPLFSAIKLSRYIDKNEIDILHIHWGNDLFLAVLAKVFSSRKVKLVYTRQMSLTREKNDIYHHFLYKNVDAYLVITQVLYDDAIKYLPIKKENVHLLYYGVPAVEKNAFDCDKYLSELGMDNSTFRLAIFGRIEKGKGQHLVVDAVKNLKKQGKIIQLGIIGHIMDEAYFDAIKDDIKKNALENNILYLGFHNQPTHIMPCFDAVILATKCETFGLVLPEAMRAGVAVIGSNCGGVPEIIDHEKTGLLFESENVSDLTTQLAKLVDDREFCKKLASAGKADADQRFSEEKHFKKLIEYFQSS
ncbi:MAG: glycosyltransferase family 4 protein [Gammaproteobacteria bacterium]|nr:glycosyltransferase family 4 protein [Gammaproteobacteria bacterium]